MQDKKQKINKKDDFFSKSCQKVVKKLVKILKRVGGGGEKEGEEGDL
jgi:predicted HAD superfamily phosphohydrolase